MAVSLIYRSRFVQKCTKCRDDAPAAVSAALAAVMAESRQDEQKPPEPRSREDEKRELRAWHRLAGVGIEFIVAVVLFGFLGRFADQKLGTTPWLMIVGFGLGFALGLYLMLREANRSFRD
jgi:ATP synthase protein I